MHNQVKLKKNFFFSLLFYKLLFRQKFLLFIFAVIFFLLIAVTQLLLVIVIYSGSILTSKPYGCSVLPCPLFFLHYISLLLFYMVLGKINLCVCVCLSINGTEKPYLCLFTLVQKRICNRFKHARTDAIA